MGMYDTVGTSCIKIKSVPEGNNLTQYMLGDEIDLPDGVHVGHEGWFVVTGGIIFKTGTHIYDKWGRKLTQVIS